MKKLLAALAISTAIFGVSACSASAPTPPSGPTESSAESSPSPATTGTVIDVRSNAEYTAGHLAGAINADVNSPQFDALIASLPPDGSYTVYCASGNRSAAATARMTAFGFTAVTDAGGMSTASSSTGLAVVTEQ